MKLKATLRLENGMEFHGWSFGSAEAVSGEVVFNTSMVGYPEQLTDAAYSGQILCLTYPLIGNYGVPSEELMAENLSLKLESDKIHPKGLIVFDVCEEYSNWEAEKGLEQWMNEQNLTGIYGIDTRELTKILRDKGSMKGEIIPQGAAHGAADGCPRAWLRPERGVFYQRRHRGQQLGHQSRPGSHRHPQPRQDGTLKVKVRRGRSTE